MIQCLNMLKWINVNQAVIKIMKNTNVDVITLTKKQMKQNMI